MKALIAAALLVAGCSKKKEDAPAPPPAPVEKPLDICAAASAALAQTTCSGSDAPDVGKAKRTFDGFIDATKKATDSSSSQFQIMCAQMLGALEKDLAKGGCKVALAAADRESITKTLDAYYAQRTQVTKTGDAATDAALAKVVEIRDAMCSCSSMMCLETVDKRLDEITPLPSSATAAAKDTGGKLMDDIGRCEAKIRSANGL